MTSQMSEGTGGGAITSGKGTPLANSSSNSLYFPASDWLTTGGAGYWAVGGLSHGLCQAVVASVPATTNEPSIQTEGYRELSETLSELSSSGQDDEWHIESEVYDPS